MGRTETDREITNEPKSARPRKRPQVRKRKKPPLLSDWRGLLKKCLTGSTLLEMSGYGVISNDADRFKRFHSYCFGVHEHTLPMARESRLCGCVVSLVSPQPARAVSASSVRCGPPNISSVTIDHDELCDLPLG